MEYIWVGLGGFAGANMRYLLGTWITLRRGTNFPLGTFLINVSGSLLIGIILTLLTQRLVADPRWRLLLVVGFLGGYTTFSSFTYESLALLEQGDWARALIYLFGSNGVGLVACYSGMIIARTAWR